MVVTQPITAQAEEVAHLSGSARNIPARRSALRTDFPALSLSTSSQSKSAASKSACRTRLLDRRSGIVVLKFLTAPNHLPVETLGMLLFSPPLGFLKRPAAARSLHSLVHLTEWR